LSAGLTGENEVRAHDEATRSAVYHGN